MELLLHLWKETFRRVLPAAVCGILAAVVLFFAFRCYRLTAVSSPKTLTGLDPERMPGSWVEDEVVHIYAAYAREADYRGGELTGVRGVHYVISLDGERYMGMFVHGERVAEADALLAACDREYLGLGSTDGQAFRVTGSVRAMDGRMLSLYRAAAGGDKAVEKQMVPCYLDVDRLDGHVPGTMWTVLILCLVLALAGGASIVWAVTWGGQKRLLARAAEFGELPQMVGKLEKFYESTDSIGAVWLDKYYLLFQSGAVSVLCRPWDVAWAYRRPERLPLLGRSRVSFRMMDGERRSLWMREYDAKKLMQALSELAPGTELGWSRAMEREYRRDRASFAHRWEEVRSDGRT